MTNETRTVAITASQIETLDNICVTADANDKTLDVALQFHSNRSEELKKQTLAFWKELALIHDVDMDKKVMKATRKNSTMVIEVLDKTDER